MDLKMHLPISNYRHMLYYYCTARFIKPYRDQVTKCTDIGKVLGNGRYIL